MPLRKYYIVHQKLTFPTPAATAYTIRALHNGRTGAIAARKKSLALLYSFIITFVYKVMTGYAPGIVSVAINTLYRVFCLFTVSVCSCTIGTLVGHCIALVSPASFRLITMAGGSNVGYRSSVCLVFPVSTLMSSSHPCLLRCRHAQRYQRKLEFLYVPNPFTSYI